MKKTRAIDEEYDCCDFCGANLCEKCGYVDDHDPAPDWQGYSDCYGWASEEVCCCSQFFYAKELDQAYNKLEYWYKRLDQLEAQYINDKRLFTQELNTARFKHERAEIDYIKRFPNETNR